MNFESPLLCTCSDIVHVHVFWDKCWFWKCILRLNSLFFYVSWLFSQASVSEGRPVDRARAWCSMINVPFYRFSPQLSEDIPLDCNDNKTLITMLWETQCYIIANKHRIEQVAQLLSAGIGHIQAPSRQQSLKAVLSDPTELKLHARPSWSVWHKNLIRILKNLTVKVINLWYF